MISLLPFDCPRTCPAYGDRWCRFNAVLSKIGPVRVDSHTAKIKVEYTDPDQLRRAVERMGGIWYGAGHYDLHDTEQDGYGFRLPMKGGFKPHDKLSKYWTQAGPDEASHWYHPCVLRADGELAYDEYGGVWGDLAQLERLKAEYCFVTAEHAAGQQGWLTERTATGDLLIHHPSGGVLQVSAGGTLATSGFTGGACHEARLALGLPVEEGSIVETGECSQVAAVIQEGR